MSLQAMSFIFGALLLAIGILGGGFEVKEIKVSSVSGKVRVVAAGVGALFVILGFLQPKDMTGLIGLVVPIGSREMSSHELNMNRYGGDYSGFDVNDIDSCESSCQGDDRCLAWTYVNPGVQGPQAKCWLKNTVPTATADSCCVSGIKTP